MQPGDERRPMSILERISDEPLDAAPYVDYLLDHHQAHLAYWLALPNDRSPDKPTARECVTHHIRCFIDDLHDIKRKLARVGCVLLMLLCASSAQAASITYEQPFAFEKHVEFNGNEEPWLGSLGQAWLVPGGVGPALLELEFDASLTGSVDFIGGIFMLSPDGGGALGAGSHAWFVDAPDGDWPWALVTHADTRAFYDVAQPAAFDMMLSGVARVTYLYEAPQEAAAITEAPEPGTLLLVTSGLLAILWRPR